MTELILSPLTANDGDNIAVLDWPLAHKARSRGTVVIVHGLGEHAARYHVLAGWLNTQGFAVRALDQYGHGESDGARGGLPSDDRLLQDLTDLVDDTRWRMTPAEPLILLGHSMGGLVAAHFVSKSMRRVDGLVLSSPLLDPSLSVVQKFLVATLPKIAPDFRVGNGLKQKYICHDPAVVTAYRNDPLVHDRISARLAALLVSAGAECIAGAPDWRVPTLLMYAGDDRLVNPGGSRAFATAAHRQMVQAHCFEHMYHEIFNEPDRDKVLAVLQTWLQNYP